MENEVRKIRRVKIGTAFHPYNVVAAEVVTPYTHSKVCIMCGNWVPEGSTIFTLGKYEHSISLCESCATLVINAILDLSAKGGQPS